MNAFRPDLIINDPKGIPVAFVEVKNRYGLSADAAIEMRRNMLTRGLPTQIPYFLLLSQDDGYLWRGSDHANPDAPPAYHFPMESVIHRYSPEKTGQRLYEDDLELLTLQWLASLSAAQRETTEEPERTLAQAGFNASIQDGIVLLEKSLPQQKSDFLLQDTAGNIVAAIDIKNLPNLSKKAAMEVRRSWISFGFWPRAPYVLLLSQDVGFLWKAPDLENPSALPSYEFPMDTVIRRYRQQTSERRLYKIVLANLIYQWLFDLTRRSSEANEEPEKTLTQAGFIDVVEGARILAEGQI